MNFIKNKNILVGLGLFLVVLLAGVLRFYNLGGLPSGFTWDEAAVGYNAWSLIHTGRDEWGKILPLVFRSFGDYKNPIHFYLTAPFVGVFGLTEFATRASAATFGVMNVVLIYFLGKELFKDWKIGLVASLMLAVSPFNIQFSRFNHELNFTIFFFMLAVLLFLKGIKGKKYLLPVSFFVFGLDLISYHSAKVVVPPMVLLLIALNFKVLWKNWKYALGGALIFLGFVGLIVFIRPELMGLDRFGQTSSVSEGSVADKVDVMAENYKQYFSREFLFESGDTNPRHSIQTTGTFYRMDMMLVPVGLMVILYGLVKGRKEGLILLSWLFLAPIPATLGGESMHVARAMFMTGSWQIVSAVGLVGIVYLLKNRYLKLIIVALFVAVLGYETSGYVKDYYENYMDKYAIEWQYGIREITEYVEENPEYMRVYMTDAFMQPYIFYLFYLEIPPADYLETVVYNETESKPSNLVDSFGRYKFRWNEIESIPSSSILYVVNPSKYDGLRYKHKFEVVRNVKYPNGSDAFFLVSGTEL